jgi:hypothetical protein
LYRLQVSELLVTVGGLGTEALDGLAQALRHRRCRR